MQKRGRERVMQKRGMDGHGSGAGWVGREIGWVGMGRGKGDGEGMEKEGGWGGACVL